MPQQVATAGGVAAQLPQNPQEVDLNTVLIIRVIEMLSGRIAALGEQRRPYLSVLASLVERSQNNTLCEKILSMVEEWVFNSTEPVPTCLKTDPI
jgi:transformation/transcription domain-associated protein